MADYRGHLTGASIFFGIYMMGLLYIFSIDAAYTRFDLIEMVAYPLALFGISLMFGLWPDVDTNSVAQGIFYTIFFLIDVILIVTEHYEEAAYLGLFALLPVLGKHRGWTHSWWALIVIPSPLLILPYFFYPDRPLFGLPFYGAAVVGYFSHLFMDGLILRLPRSRRR